MNGDFVNLTSGSVYNYFNIENHNTTAEIQNNELLHIGLDFNIDNMSAVVFVQRNGILYAVDEIADEYNTQTICEVMRQRYASNKIIIYPDASGGNRVASGADNFSILKNYGFILNVAKTNPKITERVNAVNLSFEKNTLFVNSNKCSNFVEALQNQSYSNGVPDKKSGYDHINDAGGYAVYKLLFGIKPQLN